MIYIENYLKPVTFGNRFGADMVRLRILQTGHGMDDFENRAEFCDKYREIYFDNELKEKKSGVNAVTILFIRRLEPGS